MKMVIQTPPIQYPTRDVQVAWRYKGTRWVCPKSIRSWPYGTCAPKYDTDYASPPPGWWFKSDYMRVNDAGASVYRVWLVEDTL